MMGRIKLYNTETGKWERWHVDTIPKFRLGRVLRHMRNSFRQTWRRLAGGHEVKVDSHEHLTLKRRFNEPAPFVYDYNKNFKIIML